ncbi:pelle-like serine/threonine-protein kinase pik-1 [Microplitis mediator]|uniref:pelle-like serine/threonine-protein kinase pik-1 n=1 Tax=Microplitis mediator TaxID=375433 RepID=UPI002554F11C|nr:pelle-like serine/threonine-protein kinase pik-1 [Microplitis mediator]
MSTIPKWEKYKYIYNLPYNERVEFCNILNQNDKWEELAGRWMQYDMLIIQTLRKEKNPTDELLNLWGIHNHTVLELFVLLQKMQHYRAMGLLKPFVEDKYHFLLDKGEGNLRLTINREKNYPPVNELKIDIKNFDKITYRTPIAPKVIVKEYNNKIINQAEPINLLETAPSNSNNLLAASPLVASRVSPILNRTGISQKLNALTLKAETTLPQISFEELTRATDGWNQCKILGKGGFGTVYRGIWKNTDVAVKKIERRGPESDDSYIIQLQQSLREITILNSRPHENILSLYAFSIGGQAPCLVYQFMINGSLEDWILLRQRSQPLTWLQRHEIIKGVARGLQYLHTIGERPLIHGDIKSANILLDKNFEPRIGDFGLAREGPLKDFMKVSKVHGTRPYLPEEFLRGKILSTKVDTYSYGIVCFELATGLSAYDDSRIENKFLKDFIDSWDDKDILFLKDKKPGDENDKVFSNLILLGKWCSNRLAKDRPEMELVFKKLNSI